MLLFSSYRVYAWLTLTFITLGIVGNLISICVFTSSKLRGSNGSRYSLAISIADIAVLLTYVLVEWFEHGLPVLLGPCKHWNPINFHDYSCRIFKLVSCAAQFIAAYIVVAFNVERCVAVKCPFESRMYINAKLSRWVIVCVVVAGFFVSLWKPFLSGLYYGLDNSTDLPKICMRNMDYDVLYFTFEAVFATLIMLLPVVILFFANMYLFSALVWKEKPGQKLPTVTERERKIRWEFGAMFAIISVWFCVTNIWYYIMYFRVYHSTNKEDLYDLHEHIAYKRVLQAVYYSNYCVNFLIFFFVGESYRNVIWSWLQRCRKPGNAALGPRNSTAYSSICGNPNTTHQIELSAVSTTSKNGHM